MAWARAFRALLFAGVVLATWAVARPARAASAPLCDDRGATVIADPPALEAPDEAILRSPSGRCGWDSLGMFAAVHPFRDPPSLDDNGIAAVLSPGHAKLACPIPLAVRPVRRVEGARSSVRSRVERPPRV